MKKRIIVVTKANVKFRKENGFISKVLMPISRLTPCKKRTKWRM